MYVAKHPLSKGAQARLDKHLAAAAAAGLSFVVISYDQNCSFMTFTECSPPKQDPRSGKLPTMLSYSVMQTALQNGREIDYMKMAGNPMHCVQVGAALAYCLLCTELEL